MALTDYSGLKVAITNFMSRNDLSGDAPDLITLAEARLNRQLPAVETDTTLTGVVDDRRIPLVVSMVAPVALFLVDPETGDETELTPKADGTFPYHGTAGEPAIWSVDGTNIDFDRPLDQAYTFRLRYRERFALSDSVTTNWLLTNHPDVYLAASIVWGGLLIQDSNLAVGYKTLLDGAIPEIRNIIARNRRSVSTVDPALLQSQSNRDYYDGSW